MATIAELIGYWDEQPPMHELVAAFMGVKSERHAKHTEEETRKGLAEVADLFGPARGFTPEMRQLIEMAEEMKRTHKGLIGNA